MKYTNKKILIFLITIFTINTILTLYSQAKTKGLPPKESEALMKLEKSPRHGEWITYTAENNDKVNAWIVYPERNDKAPVVIVIHEIFGLSDWIRAVADQFAAEGFIAVAPDFLSGKGPLGKGSSGLAVDEARAINSALDPAEVIRRLDGAVKYAVNLPAAEKKYAVVGFCWGGGTSFLYATKQPGLSAAVVFYGVSPSIASLSMVNAPVLGLYGGNDNRVNATIQPAEDELKRLKKSFEKEIYDGAGHGFLRQQDGQEGANLKATQAAWPRVIRFFNKAFRENESSVPETGIIEVVSIGDNLDACCDDPDHNH